MIQPAPNQNQNQNQQADAQLDRLLAHLNHAVPSVDLHTRLLHRLEDHVHSAPPHNRLRSRLQTQAAAFWAFGIVGTAGVLAALAPWLTQHPLHPGRPTPATVAMQPPSTRTQPPEHGNPVSSPFVHSPFTTAKLIAHQNPPFAAQPQPHIRNLTPSPEEAQALDDLHAPSHPAPPMPLTAQERLLTRMLRHDNDVQLAQLASEPGETRPGNERAAFQKFFDPPPPPQPEDPSPALTPLQGKSR